MRRPVKRMRTHYKLTEAGLALMLEQAERRLAVLNYDQLAEQTGLTRGSAKVLMRELIHEKRRGLQVVRRGTAGRKEIAEATATELRGPAW